MHNIKTYTNIEYLIAAKFFSFKDSTFYCKNIFPLKKFFYCKYLKLSI